MIFFSIWGNTSKILAHSSVSLFLIIHVYIIPSPANLKFFFQDETVWEKIILDTVQRKEFLNHANAIRKLK